MLTQFGQVASVKLPLDPEKGTRKGFGFIEMPRNEQAKAAIAALNGKEIYRRKIALTKSAAKGAGKQVA
jgi:RNA recognition motif-containing protein